jgi:hypothetical protein
MRIGAVRILAAVTIASVLVLAGCGSSSSSTGSQVTNSLPTPPAQSQDNTYVGVSLDTANPTTFSIYQLSNSDSTFTAQNASKLSSTGGGSSSIGGIFVSNGDFQALASSANLSTVVGFSSEIPSGVVVFNDSYSTIPSSLGTPRQVNGCIEPSGSVAVDFLALPFSFSAATPSTDTLYGNASMSYTKSTFHYMNLQQYAAGGATATTNTVALPDALCTSTVEGNVMESPADAASSHAPSIATLSPTGILQVASTPQAGPPAYSGERLLGMVEPKSSVDLASVTQGSYRGRAVDPTGVKSYSLAYFGVASAWITSPVFTQTATSLVGASVSSTSFINGTARKRTGNIMIDFGVQDSSHPGLFSKATITEPDSTNACPASLQSTGPDGNTYCTFPVAALIGEHYGKYIIFIVGQEIPKGVPMAYMLIQD